MQRKWCDKIAQVSFALWVEGEVKGRGGWSTNTRPRMLLSEGACDDGLLKCLVCEWLCQDEIGTEGGGDHGLPLAECRLGVQQGGRERIRLHAQIAGEAAGGRRTRPLPIYVVCFAEDSGLWQRWTGEMLCCHQAHVCTPCPRPSDGMHVSALSTWRLVSQPLTSKASEPRRFSFCHNRRIFVCTSMLRHLSKDALGGRSVDNEAH